MPVSSNGSSSPLPTSALEQKLKELREQSQQHSQELTQRLASSQSGQNLLHIGTSLSTLPPGLHSLLTAVHPVLTATEQTEKEQLEKLEELVNESQEIYRQRVRAQHAEEAADLYTDLCAVESIVHSLLSGDGQEEDGTLSS